MKDQHELCNHFVEGHPSIIKFAIDLASHVLCSLLRTMFTVSVVNILLYNGDFDKVTFIAHQEHILAVDLEKIKDFWLGLVNLKNTKT